MSSTKGGTHNEQQNASEENLKHSDKKARKRITTPKQRACIKTALYTCITTRQLKVVLELGDELDKRAANGGCNEEYNESINALISSLSKNKASKRVKGASSTRSRPRPRRKQPDVALVRTDDHGRTEFDVASITIGSFTVNDGGDDLSRAVVRFCFAIGVMTYEFVHKEDEKCYKVCYSIPFDDIASINFLKKIVHLKLKKPAKQSFCTLGTLVSGLSDSEVLGNAVDVDVSRGQVESNLLHTIHLKRGTTKVWQEALLAANGDLFESLIRGSVGMDEAESTPTRAASMAALEPFNRGGSYSSPFEGHTELEQVEPAYDSGVFGSVHGSSDMQLLDSATTGNVRYFDQASDFISGELNPCSRQDPTSTGMFAEYYHPVAGGLPPFEDLTSNILMVPTQCSRESTKLTGAAITDFNNNNNQPDVAVNGFEDSGYGYGDCKEAVNGVQMNIPLETRTNNASTFVDGEAAVLHSDSSEVARFERVIQGVQSLLESRNKRVETLSKATEGENSGGKQDSKVITTGSKRALLNKDSFYWLDHVDMTTLFDANAVKKSA